MLSTNITKYCNSNKTDGKEFYKRKVKIFNSLISQVFLSGGPFGTVVSLIISGWIAGGPLGWPSLFYIFGAISLMWSALWFVWGSNSPAEHKTIDPEERYYIEASLGQGEQSEVDI